MSVKSNSESVPVDPTKFKQQNLPSKIVKPQENKKIKAVPKRGKFDNFPEISLSLNRR